MSQFHVDSSTSRATNADFTILYDESFTAKRTLENMFGTTIVKLFSLEDGRSKLKPLIK